MTTKRSKIFSRDPVTILLVLCFSVLASVFYSTDFRESLDHVFFDFIIRTLPQSGVSDQVVVISIDEQSIRSLETDELRVRVDSRKRPYLGTWAMVRTANVLANTGAKSIVLLMPEHAFPASNVDMADLVETVHFDERIFIGTHGLNKLYPNLHKLPEAYRRIGNQVAGYETFRARSNSIVRSLPFTSYRGQLELENLPARIATFVDHQLGFKPGSFYLRHRDPSYYKTISIADFLVDPQSYMDDLAQKVVVVGYVVARDAGFQTSEQMSANTPLTGPFPTYEKGVSTTYLMANAIDNLIHRETIRHGEWVTTAIQTILVAVICGLSWEFGSAVAAAVTVLVWLCLFVVHRLLMGQLHLFIPLSDTFLVTVLITVFAAVRRLRQELEVLAEVEAATSAKTEVATVQAHFLEGFAAWLQSKTDEVVRPLKQSQSREKELLDEQTMDLYRRAFAASEEFGEYLESIRQLPAMESLAKNRLSKVDVSVRELLGFIVLRFDAKAREKGIQFQIEIDDRGDRLFTNRQLFDGILFNLISNAVKYGPKNQKILIESKRIGKFLHISVQDEGPGIADDLKERIFERFYRIKDERLYATKGTGIGLYLTRYFAAALDGKITVESTVGKGSRFTVVLPCP